MKVQNMTSSKGNKIANQFILQGAVFQMPDCTYEGTAFQSYDSVIAFKATHNTNTGGCYQVFIDERYWDYSGTTGKYRNQFLGETKKETEAKIKSGEYILVNLN